MINNSSSSATEQNAYRLYPVDPQFQKRFDPSTALADHSAAPPRPQHSYQHYTSKYEPVKGRHMLTMSLDSQASSPSQLSPEDTHGMSIPHSPREREDYRLYGAPMSTSTSASPTGSPQIYSVSPQLQPQPRHWSLYGSPCVSVSQGGAGGPERPYFAQQQQITYSPLDQQHERVPTPHPQPAYYPQHQQPPQQQQARAAVLACPCPQHAFKKHFFNAKQCAGHLPSYGQHLAQQQHHQHQQQAHHHYQAQQQNHQQVGNHLYSPAGMYGHQNNPPQQAPARPIPPIPVPQPVYHHQQNMHHQQMALYPQLQPQPPPQPPPPRVSSPHLRPLSGAPNPGQFQAPYMPQVPTPTPTSGLSHLVFSLQSYGLAPPAQQQPPNPPEVRPAPPLPDLGALTDTTTNEYLHSEYEVDYTEARHLSFPSSAYGSVADPSFCLRLKSKRSSLVEASV